MRTTSRVAADILRVLPRKRLSSKVGDLADLRGPRPLLQAAIQGFCRALDVDLSEAEVPPGGFDSFNGFFTRRLRPGARPVDLQPDTLLSPADGRVEDLGEVGADRTLYVKGRTYTVGELLGDEDEAGAFTGGQFFIVYLSPRDYHRVHAPVTGRVSQLRHVGGTLYPVNAIGLQHVPNLFAQNERVVTYQDSARFGRVATIMVGAIGVGRISMSYEPRVMTNVGTGVERLIDYQGEGPELERGGELGVFHLGSTAIVLVGPQSTGLRFQVEPGAKVRVGQALLGAGVL